MLPDSVPLYLPVQPPGLIGSLASTVHSFAYKGSAIVTNAESGLSSEVDLSEPGILSTKPKHSVRSSSYLDPCACNILVKIYHY